MTSPIAGGHLLRYGIPADQEFLLGEFADTYDQLVVNANILAHAPGALTSFIAHRCKKPYFIDPQTHAFQHDTTYLESKSTSENPAGQLKRPFRILVEKYGAPVTKVLEGESVIPEDFSESNIPEFCRNVMDFQMEALTEEIDGSDAKKYYDFLSKRSVLNNAALCPSLVVAPYFYMASEFLDDWLRVNVLCLKACMKIAGDQPVAAEIVLSKDVLGNKIVRDRILKAYGSVRPSAYLLWIDSFVEQGASCAELTAFAELVRLFAETAPVVNLFGGYFSVVLAKSGVLSNPVGVTHGLGYGESRGVLPVGGGFPVPKFYIPMLHDRIPFRNALRVVKTLDGLQSANRFHTAICDCKECLSVIRENPERDFLKYGLTAPPVSPMRRNSLTVKEFATAETKRHCVRHYMWTKEREYTDTKPGKKIVDELTDTFEKLKRPMGPESVSYCITWARVLANYS